MRVQWCSNFLVMIIRDMILGYSSSRMEIPVELAKEELAGLPLLVIKGLSVSSVTDCGRPVTS